MKHVILGDTHFGNPQHIEFQTKFMLGQLLPYMTKNNIKHVVQLGDIFHNRLSTDTLVLSTLVDIFHNFHAYDITFTILVGNHDMYYKDRRDVSPLSILEKACSNIKVIWDTKRVDNFLYVPWLLPTDKLPKIKKTDIVFGHFEMKDFYMSRAFKSTHGLDAKSFKDAVSVFSGHYHGKQTAGNITYVGTPYQLNYSDYGIEKGFMMLDCKTNEIAWIETNINKHYKVLIDTDDKMVYYSDGIDEDIAISPKEYKMFANSVVTISSSKDVAYTRKVVDAIKAVNPHKVKFVVIKTLELDAVDIDSCIESASKFDIEEKLMGFFDDDVKSEMLAGMIVEAKNTMSDV